MINGSSDVHVDNTYVNITVIKNNELMLPSYNSCDGFIRWDGDVFIQPTSPASFAFARPTKWSSDVAGRYRHLGLQVGPSYVEPYRILLDID